MAKTQFTEDEQAVRNVFFPPSDPHGLANAMRQNLTNALARDLELFPILVRQGQRFSRFRGPEITTLDVGSHPNGWFCVYYLACDCDDATGSNMSNWLQWSSALFGYSRDSHPLAPLIVPPTDIRDELVERKMNPRGKVRFLSIDVVAFYIAAQTQTWAHPAQMSAIKGRINAILNRGPVCIPVPREDLMDTEEVDAEALLAQSTLPSIRVPKAGHGLRDYNPIPSTTTVKATISDMLADLSMGLDAPDDVYDFEPLRITDPIVVPAPSVATVSISENDTLADAERKLGDAMALIAKLREKAHQEMLAKLREKAKDFTVYDVYSRDGEVVPHKVTIRMADGTMHTLVNEDHIEFEVCPPADPTMPDLSDTDTLLGTLD